MKTPNSLFISLILSLLFCIVVNAQITYEVVMVRGHVIYNGEDLNRGDRIEFYDLDDGANLKYHLVNFSFGSDKDALHLLDINRRKIVVVPAQAVRPGRDLMLATRGIKYIRSDFEFQRAFTPGESVIALLSEDTLICRGLQKYRFTGDEVLVASFEYQGQEFSNIIGRNDTLFLTRNNLFGIENEEGGRQINSFEVSNISLVWVNSESLEFATRHLDIKPFSLYFLDDIVNYFVAVRYGSIGMNRDAIYNMLVPNFVTERQIQREHNLLTAEFARRWLFEKIDAALAIQ